MHKAFLVGFLAGEVTQGELNVLT